MDVFDFMFKANFMKTYSVLEVMKGLVFDWPRFWRLLERELRLSFGLNLPPMWFLIPHFFKVFLQSGSGRFHRVFFAFSFVCSRVSCVLLCLSRVSARVFVCDLFMSMRFI